MNSNLQELADLLERRVSIIADRELYQRDPDEHLTRLREVSESIAAKHAKLKPQLDARLNHFMTGCSYEKALDWIRGLLQNG